MKLQQKSPANLLKIDLAVSLTNSEELENKPSHFPVWKNQIHSSLKMKEWVSIVRRLFSTKTWDNSKKF